QPPQPLAPASRAPFGWAVGHPPTPGQEGLEAGDHLRGTPGGPWCVILVLPPSRHTHALAEAVRLGADDYLLLIEEAELERLLNLRLTLAERKVENNLARRRMMDALTESEARFRALLEAAPDAVLVVDGGGRVELMNAQAERLSGYARSERLGRPVEVLVPGAARAAQVCYRQGHFERPVTRPTGAGRDLALRRKDGSEVPVEVALAVQGNGERASVIAAVRDV